MVAGILTLTTPPVQAAGEVYGVLASDGNIYATTVDDPTTPGEKIFKQAVTHLFAASEVTTIADYTFFRCKNLIAVDMPKVTKIGQFAFADCINLNSVKFPMVTEIGDNAFIGCDLLPNVNFPVATTIGNYAFLNCSRLSKLTLGVVPPTVGTYAFDRTAATKTLTIDGGNTTATLDVYKAVADGNTTDDFWYGWTLAVTPYPVTVNGGSGSVDYRGGDQVTITAAAPATGQRFTTWSIVTGGITLAEPTNPSTTFTMPEKAVEVTANYEPTPTQTYTLTYNTNGGTGTMKEQVFNPGTKQVLVKNTFERSGYGFSGWNTKPDGTGTAYQDGADLLATADTTLYAQWTEGRFKVSGKVVNSSNNPVSDVNIEQKQGNR